MEFTAFRGLTKSPSFGLILDRIIASFAFSYKNIEYLVLSLRSAIGKSVHWISNPFQLH
jgi:hypothetical protein